MRGGKRPGAGRRPRFGAYRQTTTMRVPVQLKEQVIAYLEQLCVDTQQSGRRIVSKSKHSARHGQTDYVTVSDKKIKRATAILKAAIKLKANAGGAIKTEIRRALNILQ